MNDANLERLASQANEEGLVIEPQLLEKMELVLASVITKKTAGFYDWFFAKFSAWCEGFDYTSLPASQETVNRFFLDVPERYTGRSLRHFRTAIRMRHLRAGFKDPTRTDIVSTAIFARCRAAIAPHRTVLYLDDLMRVIDNIGMDVLSDMRDRSLLLSGYFGPLRLHELRSLRREDIVFRSDDMLLFLRESKRRVIQVKRSQNLQYCSVACLQTYVRFAAIDHGWVFVDCRYGRVNQSAALSAHSIAAIVTARCRNAGIDSSVRYSPESLFAGHIVSGHEAGLRISDLMVQTGMRANAIMRYRRFVRPKRPASASYLGL